MPAKEPSLAHSSWANWLPETDRAIVDEVLGVLGVEGEMQDLAHLLHLLPRLSLLARYVARFEIATGIPWLRWSESLASANTILAEQGIQASPLNRRGGNNPYLVGLAPLSACFTQPLDPKIEGQYLGLGAIFFAVLAMDKSGKREKFHAVADGLRMSRDTIYPAGRLLSLLPTPVRNSADFTDHVKSALPSVKASSDAKKENGRRFVNALTNLLGFLESTKPDREGGVIKPGNNIRQITPIRFPIDDPGGGSQWRPPGVISEVDITSSGIEDYPDLLMPPEAPLLFYTEDIDADTAEPAEAISEEGVAARARQTRYWLSRYYSITPVDRALLNPLERSRLVGALRRAMAPSVPFNDGLIACVISLSYFLGMDLGDILRLEFSHKSSLDPAAGIYRKPLLRPKSGYVPKDDEYQYYEEKPKVIDLALPKFVADYLGRLEQERKMPSLTTFNSATGLDPDVCLEKTKRFLDSLREHGRYQLYIERIRASLRNDLSAHCRNPVITYLLAGTEDQQAPMLSYYQAIRFEYLKQMYKESCQRLMAEEYKVF